MTDETLRAIQAIASLIGVVLTPIGVILAAYVVTKLNRIEKSVNGKMEELLAVTKTASHAEGVLAEHDRDKTLLTGTDEEPLVVKLVEEEKEK